MLTFPKAILLTAFICSLAFADSGVDSTNDDNFLIPPGGTVLPVVSSICNLTQLTLYVSFASTTNILMYVYPPAMEGGCKTMNMYYTALGPPALPSTLNLTAWYISDIMDGLTCFGIENADNVNSANITISASMDCNPNNDYAEDQGWYFAKPSPDTQPDLPADYSSGTHQPNSAFIETSVTTMLALVLMLFWMGI